MLKGQRERASLRNFIGRNGVDPAGNLNDIRLEAFGPIVTVNGGNSLVISGHRERALLAAFLLHPGQRRSFDVLEETLWDGNRPKDVRHAIQTLVMRLRRHLPNGCIETTAGGYRIVVEQSAVDVHLFEALIEEARECVRANRGERAFDCYSLALRYGGNGDPWEDLGASEYGRSAKARVIEMRLAAEEEQAELMLVTGRAAIGRLQQLSVEKPLRERRWSLLMRALYDSGRQSEALRSYATARIIGREKVGGDPGPELVELERRVLAHEELPPISLTPPHP